MADNETIADVLAAMRDEGRTGESSCLEWVGAKMRHYADRIEAAHKRERENYDAKIADLQLRVKLWTDRSDELVKKCVEQYAKLKQVGNSAKLREVVRKLLDALYDMGVDENTLAIAIESPNCQMKSEYTLSVIKEARAALAAPPRNCDKVKTSWDVLKEWHEGLDTANDIVRMLDWLLAPATEKEGGNDADK